VNFGDGLRGARPFHGIGSPVQAGGRAIVKADAALRTSLAQQRCENHDRIFSTYRILRWTLER